MSIEKVLTVLSSIVALISILVILSTADNKAVANSVRIEDISKRLDRDILEIKDALIRIDNKIDSLRKD